MNPDTMPYIRIELAGFKQQVVRMLTDHNNEINGMIREEVESRLTSDWVAKNVEIAVKSLIRFVIEDAVATRDVKKMIHAFIIRKIEEALCGEGKQQNMRDMPTLPLQGTRQDVPPSKTPG